jgi:hypothetical protein
MSDQLWVKFILKSNISARGYGRSDNEALEWMRLIAAQTHRRAYPLGAATQKRRSARVALRDVYSNIVTRPIEYFRGYRRIATLKMKANINKHISNFLNIADVDCRVISQMGYISPCGRNCCKDVLCNNA